MLFFITKKRIKIMIENCLLLKHENLKNQPVFSKTKKSLYDSECDYECDHECDHECGVWEYARARATPSHRESEKNAIGEKSVTALLTKDYIGSGHGPPYTSLMILRTAPMIRTRSI